MMYRPELAELPEVRQTSTSVLRLQDTLLKRMPSIADLSLDRYYGSSARAEEAAQLAADIGAAFDIKRMIDKRSRAIQRAKELAKTRMLREIERQVPRTGRKMVSAQKQQEKRFVRDVARRMGLGTDLYR